MSRRIIGVPSNSNSADYGGYFISSDILGFLKHTDKAIFLDNRDIAVIDEEKLDLFDFDGSPITRPITQVAWELGEQRRVHMHITL